MGFITVSAIGTVFIFQSEILLVIIFNAYFVYY